MKETEKFEIKLEDVESMVINNIKAAKDAREMAAYHLKGVLIAKRFPLADRWRLFVEHGHVLETNSFLVNTESFFGRDIGSAAVWIDAPFYTDKNGLMKLTDIVKALEYEENYDEFVSMYGFFSSEKGDYTHAEFVEVVKENALRLGIFAFYNDW